MKMRLRNKAICTIITLVAISWAVVILFFLTQMDGMGDRDFCNEAYKRELARLKTWREIEMAKLDGLPEAKRLEAQLIIDYTLQIAAGKLQGSIMSRDDEECAKLRLHWPEGIEKIGLWLNGTIEFIMVNVRWENAAQADDAALRIR